MSSLVAAMGDVFLVSLPFLAIALVLAVITPEQRLATREDAAAEGDVNLESSAAGAMH
jgi:hypothetical protein